MKRRQADEGDLSPMVAYPNVLLEDSMHNQEGGHFTHKIRKEVISTILMWLFRNLKKDVFRVLSGDSGSGE